MTDGDFTLPAGGFISRAVPVEDISIKPGDGRTVEAYLAVFDVETEITDHQGRYKESIDRAAFNKAINDARPQGSRSTWKTGVYYNHAMTLHGTPSERFSLPVAMTQQIIPEARGVRVIDRYAKTATADEVLELIRDGAVAGYSFTGRIIRSDPNRAPRGGFRPSAGGVLQVVRRLELGLSEYGPTPIPAYAEAGVLSMRAAYLTLLANGVPPEDAARFASATPLGQQSEPEPEDADTPDMEGAVAEEPPAEDAEHSDRHAEFVARLRTLRDIRPGLRPPPVATLAAAALAERGGDPAA